MAHVFNEAKRMLFAGELDLNADDIRGLLVMSNTTVDTENDGILDLADFSTLDECDDDTYARQALTNETVTADDSNDRAEFDADDITFENTGDATRDIAGLLLYKHVDGTAANDKPIAFYDFTATLDGNDLVLTVDAEGLLQLS